MVKLTFAVLFFCSIALVSSLPNGNGQFQQFNITSSRAGGIGVLAIETITDYMLYSEAAYKTQAEAQAHCRKISEETDLSIINAALFRAIRLGNFPPAGTYWINGEEAPGSNYEAKSDNCEAMQSDFDLTGVTMRARAPTPYCLVLVKGNTLDNTYVQEVPCTSRYSVLCSFRTDPATCTP